MEQIVRVTGILIETDSILLVKEEIPGQPHREWSLPGGKLETGESMRDGLIREMKEETGLDINVGDLLYVCERISQDIHAVHVTFLVRRTGGMLVKGRERPPSENNSKPIKLVPISDLGEYGFPPEFMGLVMARFPGKGSYMGDVDNIGL